MKWWLLLMLVAGCSTKANGRYCDTTCADPGMHCDTIKHECVAGAPDMGLDMNGSVDDLLMPDIAGADLTYEDLTPPPACTTSTNCPDSFPVCDSTSHACRACSGAGDDPACAVRSASTPHCRLSGANMGLCVACNVNADCPAATPTCNPNGTCRACAANNDCDSQLCINGDGTCIPTSDVYYVDSSNDPGQNSCADGAAGGKDGSLMHPYCQITTAITALSLQTRHYIRVAGSANNYDGFEIANTTGTLTILGPGRSASPPATVQAATNSSAIHLDPAAGNCSVAIVGLTVIGNGGVSVLLCGDNNSPVDLTVIDSSFSGSTKSAVFLQDCNAAIAESLMIGAGQSGLSIASTATYSVQNCAIYNNATGVTFGSANGKFSFNTIINNMGTTGVTCNAAAVIADSIVFNNKPTGGGTPTQINGSSSCTMSNVVIGAGDNYAGPGNKILLDPAFVTSDYHLDVTPGTPLMKNQACCIDQINAAGPSPSPSPLPTVDIDGNKRPLNMVGHWDIGADEAM